MVQLIAFTLSLIFAMCFFAAWLFIAIRFDGEIRRLYESDKERWIALGSPMGFFWIPKEKTSFFKATGSRNALIFRFIAGGLNVPIQPPETTRGESQPSVNP